MRVALIAESFLPHMNGVTNSLIQVLRHLEERGHEALVLAPGPGRAVLDTGRMHGAGFTGYRSLPWPGYPQVRIALAATRTLVGVLGDFRPDVVHLASPFVLGWQGQRAAETLDVPTVAVYQTDIPGYASRYGLPGTEAMLERHLVRLHNRADRTLAPSSAAIAGLERLGIERVRLWARGVDARLFHPGRRDEEWRRRIAPNGEAIVGYVGRLAPEKQVEDLAALRGLRGVRTVIVGDGPSRQELQRRLPEAVFLGFRAGEELAALVASFDLFVHPGEHETFCQTIQEALASGVPVVATGRGGPLDLVDSSRTGWLYRPGDLGDLRARVADLAGDPTKRRAFAEQARPSVESRTWERLGDELVEHYAEVRARRGVAAPTRSPGRRWTRFVALGDSITEGLCDASRQRTGEWRGWADRLAMLLATGESGRDLDYANLAVRSKRIGEVVAEQLPRALALRPDLVSVFAGANDLVRVRADPERLAAELGAGVARLREAGADALVVGVFLPPYRGLGALRRRVRRFNRALAAACAESGAVFLDVSAAPEFGDPRAFAADRVHLSSMGHRALCYRAAAALGIAGADLFGALDAAVHVGTVHLDTAGDRDAEPGERMPTLRWLLRHAVPWAGRRVRGRRAGDGLPAKHSEAVRVRVEG